MPKISIKVKLKAEKLREEIEHHNRMYYTDAAPEISDFEFDKLMKELTDIEAKYPGLKTADSPTQRVGGGPLKGFKSAAHSEPMMSLDNTYSADELREFDARAVRISSPTVTEAWRRHPVFLHDSPTFRDWHPHNASRRRSASSTCCISGCVSPPRFRSSLAAEML